MAEAEVNDEEACPVCHKPVFHHSVSSYSLVYWDAVDHGNNLLQMFCSIEHLKEWARRG